MTYRFLIEGDPVSLNRPRFTATQFKIKAYDNQKDIKKVIRCGFITQIRSQGILHRLKGHLIINMTFGIRMPKGTSQKRLKCENGNYTGKRPDLDNYIKMYSDVMTGLIYEDDSQIVCLNCKKICSIKPYVEIYISEVSNMIHEHAVTVKEHITLNNIDYMVLKANRLGKIDREIIRVFMEEDGEGKHYYFEVEGPKGAN